jgi:hypothetical protein
VLHQALKKVQAALKELHVELEDAREQRRVADALLLRMRDNLRSTLNRNNAATHTPVLSLRPPKAL